jgi:hypothetical protein
MRPAPTQPAQERNPHDQYDRAGVPRPHVRRGRVTTQSFHGWIDQRQYIELTRDIAQQFAGLYGGMFIIPDPFIRESGARITGMDDPTMKMSRASARRRRDTQSGWLTSQMSSGKRLRVQSLTLVARVP